MLEVVSQLKYLRNSDGMLDTEIACRVANASSACARLHQAKVWSSKALSLSTNIHFLQTSVKTVLLYGGETWPVLNKHLNQLSGFHIHCLFCGISLSDHIANPVILKQCETLSVGSLLRSKSLRWFGHTCRMSDSRLPKVLKQGQ